MARAQPGRGRHRQQQAQAVEHLPPAQAAFAEALQALPARARRQLLQAAEQAFGAAPGFGVLRAASAPLLDGLLDGPQVGGAGRAFAQAHQPVGGFAENARVQRLLVHQARLRQAMKAARM